MVAERAPGTLALCQRRQRLPRTLTVFLGTKFPWPIFGAAVTEPPAERPFPTAPADSPVTSRSRTQPLVIGLVTSR